MDFAALTAAVGAGLSEVRACLIVSRDGLTLGSYPPNEEGGAMERWMRLASLGDVERGFAVVGEECWVFCSRGPYSALAVAKASARPGLILERLDQMVLAAEEARLRKEGIGPQATRDPAGAAAARRRRPSSPPTSVHPQGPGSRPAVTAPSSPPQARVAPERATPPGAAGTGPATAPAAASPTRPGAPPEGTPSDAKDQPEPTGDEAEKGSFPGQRTLWVMDADDLTKEFAGLLEDPDDPGRY